MCRPYRNTMRKLWTSAKRLYTPKHSAQNRSARVRCIQLKGIHRKQVFCFLDRSNKEANKIKRSADAFTAETQSHTRNEHEAVKAPPEKIDGGIKERLQEYRASKQRKRSRVNSDGTIIRQKEEKLDVVGSRTKCQGTTAERITAKTAHKGTTEYEAADNLMDIELLTCLYYQMCFVEAKSEETFRTQEKSAMVSRS